MSFYAKLNSRYVVDAQFGGRPDSSIIRAYLHGEKMSKSTKVSSFWFIGNDAYSYETKIAEKAYDGSHKKLYLNTTRYSNTTNGYQSELRHMAKQMGYEIVDVGDAHSFRIKHSFSRPDDPQA